MNVRFQEVDKLQEYVTISIITLMMLLIIENKVLADSPIDVTISVLNEKGEPLKYVTIWGFHNPYDRYNSNMDLDMESLWRTTKRYQASAVFVRSNNNILPGLKILPMSNKQGYSYESIKYPNLRVPRPDNVTIGYTFIKHGYFPAKYQLVGNQDESEYEVEIKLQRDPAVEMGDKKRNTYQEMFDRLRYEISDQRKNEDRTLENYSRLENIRAEFNDAAELAIRFGDMNTAAQIYYNMAMMPEILLLNGDAVGHRGGRPGSKANTEILNKANRLATDLLYIRMEKLSAEGRRYGKYNTLYRKMPADLRKEFNDYLEKYTTLLDSAGDKIWPVYHLLLVSHFERIGLFADAFKQLKKVRDYEPKYFDYDSYLKDMKIKMKLSGVAVPEDF